MRRILLGFAALALALAFPRGEAAAAGADFYRGRTVTIVVSSAVGGGYDALSRIIGRHIGRHIPGQPTVIINNMPGAGGIAATNYLYNNAPKDGTVMGGVQNNTPLEPLLGTAQARYDPTKFNWLGSPSVEIGLVVVWNTVPVNSIADMQRREVVMGSTGANSTPSFYARLLNETLGTKMKLIVGYPGQNDSFIAMERGELDGHPSMFYSSMMATQPDLLRDKKVKLLLQYGPFKEPALPNVPFVMDIEKDPEDRALLEAGFAALALGRPYLMPPGVPAERVAIMRKALADTFVDPGFRAEATRIGMAPNQPRTGEQLQAVIAQTYRAPPAVIARLRRLTAAPQ
jgi:tripartite-type tricarboxylate transporter receptor subunit TctC